MIGPSKQWQINNSGKRPDMVSVSPYAWMFTFSDLLMLLLTLFVLRLSMSTLDGVSLKQKLSEFSSKSRSEQSSPMIDQGTKTPRELEISNPQLSRQVQQLITALADGLQQSLGAPEPERASGGSLSFSGSVELLARADGCLLRLAGSSFASESGELSFMAVEAIQTLSRTLKGEQYSIRINGHSPQHNLAGKTESSSSWDISRNQALAVLRQMIDAGVGPEHISAAAYADSKPIPESINRNEQLQNRRVEIHVTLEEK